MENIMTIDQRVVAAFLEKLDSDESIPREVVELIRALFNQDRLTDSDAILKAIREGVKQSAKTSAT